MNFINMKRFLLTLAVLIPYILFAQTNINMPSGSNTASHTTCNARFYDTGGLNGNHGVNQNSSIKFTPATAGLAIRIQFNIFTVGEGAVMTLYDGPDNTYPVIAVYDEFINPSGLAIVAGPPPTNPDGSIYIEFTSGTMNEIGWQADVTCRAPCQSFNVQIDPLVTTKPLVEDIYMNVCRDSCITFGAEAVFLQNNINYTQTQNNTLFIWRFGFTQVDTQQVITRCFDQVRGWDYTLYAVDTMECFSNSMFKGRVRVSSNPIAATPPLPNACSGGQYDVYVGNDPQATIIVHSVGASISGELSEADTVFLPDGSNVCYHSDLLYDIFDPGQTLNNINHLLGIRMCLEHSYLGDISIRLTCPSGQTAILKEQFANVPPMPPGGVVDNSCSGQGGVTNLGCAPDPGTGSACYLVPGIGWDYEFRPGATGCFGTGGATVGYNYTDQCGTTWTGPSLLPSIPNTFTNTPTNPVFYGSFQNLNALLGCPLNGNWRITICDHWGIDNGYIFNWALSLDQSIIPGGWDYTVNVDTVIWHGNNITPTGRTSATIDLGSAGVNVYDVTVIDEYGCQFDTTFTIEVVQSPEPDINDGLDTARICAGEMVILNANYEDPDAQYWWNTGATTDEIIATVEGLYFIQITAMTQDQTLICTGADSIFVSVNYHPLPDFDVDNLGGCAPVKVQFENLTVEEEGTQFSYEWRLYNLDGQQMFFSNQKNPEFFIEEPGTYHVQLVGTTENGCVDSIIKWNYLEVYPQPIAEFSADPEVSLLSEQGGVVTFTNYCDSLKFANSPDAEWYWDFGDDVRESTSWNPVHTYQTWGDYIVTFDITTAHGCNGRIQHKVIIEEDLQFPNVITPNGDGINDVFAIKNLDPNIDPEDPDKYRTNTLQIFDRWGKKVYDVENYDTYMKGDQIYVGEKVFDANGLPDGQYRFAFIYKGRIKHVNYSGSLLIIRDKK